MNPVGGGKEGEKPAPDGCVLVAIADKAHTSNFRVDVPFTWGWIPNTQIPQNVGAHRVSAIAVVGQAGFEPAPFRAALSRRSAIKATVPYGPPRRTMSRGGYSVVQAVENCIYAFWDAA